jgi:hypothetical protein
MPTPAHGVATVNWLQCRPGERRLEFVISAGAYTGASPVMTVI